jgi:hypothetical protein
MNSETKNRKWLWLAGAALVVLYFAPSVVRSFREAAAYQERMREMNAQAGNARAGMRGPGAAVSQPGGTSVPQGAGVAPPTATPSRLTGMWVNQQAVASAELCTVNLEIRDKGQGEVNGYVKLLCYPTMAYFAKHHEPVNPQAVLTKVLNPIAAIMSGGVKDGAVAFHVDKVVGTQEDGCGLTAFTVTPFGSDEIAIEWQRGACPGGQMTLTRQGR